MTALLRCLCVASVAAILLGCGNAPGGEGPLGVAQQAVNACAETVPASRAVDGFPAYAQCTSIENGAIWSNNGIDTASSSQGADWVRTQYSGGYQCTEFARRYFMFRWGIDYQHGNAGEWCDGTLPSTLALATSPTHGDLIVFAPGSCGADSTTGHIAVVDTVDMAGGKVTIVEQNKASRRATQQSCAKCYLHAVKNDGSAGGSAGASSGGASSGGTGAGAPATGGASSGAAGASSGGTASGGGASLGGTQSGGTLSSGGSAVAVAGSVGTGGAATIGGSAGSGGANSSGTPSSSASNDATAAEDAGCSVVQAGLAGDGPGGAGLVLACAALRFWLRRRVVSPRGR